MTHPAKDFLEEAIKHSQKKTSGVHFCIKPVDYEKLNLVCEHFGLTKVDWFEAMIKQSFEAYLEDK